MDHPRNEAEARPWYGDPRRWAVVAGGAAGLVVLVLGAAFAHAYTTAEIPPPAALTPPEPSVVYDASGELVATLDPAAIGSNVVLDDLPAHVAQATLAAEDRDFRDHGGFSVTGILRAAWANLTSGEVVQGGSTIPQQYVDLAITDIPDSLAGKFREVAIAARLDDTLSKDRVLEMYLNTVPYGRTARGVEAAARTYFGTSASELDVNQAATLAGMIAAPSAFDPERHPDRARARRDYVLGGMAEQGWLDPDEAEALKGDPLPEVATDPLVEFGADAYFLDAVRDAVPALLDEEQRDPFVDLTIHTTLDRRMQQLAVDSLRQQLADVDHTGAVVTVDAGSGAVRALVGGRDFAAQQFNVATNGKRQAGSAFKPFALTALVARGDSPASDVDAPRTVEVPDVDGTAEIGNYTDRGYGEVSVREATRRSINTAYVNLARELGYGTVVETAHALGIRSELPEVPTTVLGVGGVTPLEMAGAYATLAAEGTRHPTHLVTRIETRSGEVLYEHEAASEPVLAPRAAAAVTDVLRDVVEDGTGVNAALERPVAGKTGTTNDHRDAWFVGYTPRFATAVWVGNLDNSSTGSVTGGSLPARAWGAYMAEAVAPTEPMSFPEPDWSLLEERDLGDPDPEDRETLTPDGSPSPSASPSPTASPSPSASPSPTGDPSPSPSPTSDASPSPSPTAEPSPSSEPSPSTDPSPTSEPSDEPTSEPSPDRTSDTGSTSEGETTTTSDATTGTDADATSEPSPSPSPSPSDG